MAEMPYVVKQLIAWAGWQQAEEETVDFPGEEIDTETTYQHRLAELPPDLLAQAVRRLRDVLPEDLKAAIRGEVEEDGPGAWVAGNHFGFGMRLRNELRDAGLSDELLPRKNWDDYYAVVTEIAAGARPVPDALQPLLRERATPCDNGCMNGSALLPLDTLSWLTEQWTRTQAQAAETLRMLTEYSRELDAVRIERTQLAAALDDERAASSELRRRAARAEQRVLALEKRLRLAGIASEG